MPDDRIHPFERVPSDWSEAFATLPTEMPDADAWQRISRTAWPQRRRQNWPAWLATAAVLALAAVLPWQLATPPESRPTAPISARPDAVPATRAGTAAARADAPAAEASPVVRNVTDVGVPASSTPAPFRDDPRDDPQRIASAEPAAIRPVPQPGDAPLETGAHTRLASDTALNAADTSGTPVDAPATDTELERLYAESAQLEALVAMARDDRVAITGTAATLASQYDAQVAEIDARLIALGTTQRGATREERMRLWRERVAALRELAGFESTQRLLAAHGERYDAMLVSID
jgi:hypothetical protein